MPIDPSIPRCQHIRTNGVPCGSPSLKRRTLCYYHFQTRRQPQRPLRRRPNLEDSDAIQLGIAEVIRRIENNDIDLRAAGLLLYGYQTASANLKGCHNQPSWRDVVLDSTEEDPNLELEVEEPKKLPQSVSASHDETEGEGILITTSPRTVNEQDPIPTDLN